MSSTTTYRQIPEKPFKSVRDIGFAEDRNARYRRTMEDGHCMIDGFRGVDRDALFAIYDGHGGRGVVTLVEKLFHENVEKCIQEMILQSNNDGNNNNSGPQHEYNSEQVKQAIQQAYKLTDEGTKEVQFGGATCVSCLLLSNRDSNSRTLYTANCGDARAVIAENWEAKVLTYDHKATDPEEQKRIIGKGGSIVNERVNGFLALARSFGNNTLKEWVTSEPYQTVTTPLTSDHNLLILACDGLWDVIENQEAVDFCKRLLEAEVGTNGAQQCAQQLLDLAKEKGSTDNLSVMVILL